MGGEGGGQIANRTRRRLGLVISQLPVWVTWDLEAEVTLAAHVGDRSRSLLPGDALLHPALPSHLHREGAPCVHNPSVQ